MISGPPLVNGKLVMLLASIGLAADLIFIYYLKDPFQHNSNDLSLKSILFHVLADFIASLGVLIGGDGSLDGSWWIHFWPFLVHKFVPRVARNREVLVKYHEVSGGRGKEV